MKIYERRLRETIVETFDVASPKMSEYMRFIDFLKDAKFVGRRISSGGDVLLYQTDYAACIQRRVLSDVSIKMVDLRFFEPNLGVIVSSVEKYKDVNLLYQAVVKQVESDFHKVHEADEFGRRK
jgi:hypothetical protein